MKYIPVRDETKALLDDNPETIRSYYITNALFLDACVRAGLRKLRVKCDRDLIIGHLEKLERSKQKRYERASITKTKKNHEMRVKRAEKKLNGEL